MVQYYDDGKRAVYNGYAFTRDERTGYYLSTSRIGDRRKRLHVYVWECHNGPVPEGYAVHHKDHNKANNEIDNFELMPIDEHSRHHITLYINNNLADVKRTLLEKAVPASKAWHASEEGHDWHKQHYEQVKDKLHARESMTCEWCGQPFMGQPGHSKFCSNRCKSAYRRASGVDDIVKICEQCGGEYIGSKYNKSRFCPECRYQGRPSRRTRRCV